MVVSVSTFSILSVKDCWNFAHLCSKRCVHIPPLQTTASIWRLLSWFDGGVSYCTGPWSWVPDSCWRTESFEPVASPSFLQTTWEVENTAVTSLKVRQLVISHSEQVWSGGRPLKMGKLSNYFPKNKEESRNADQSCLMFKKALKVWSFFLASGFPAKRSWDVMRYMLKQE